MKRILLFTLLLFFVLESFSQISPNPENFKKGKYIDLHIGSSLGNVRDDVISPLSYFSIGQGLNASYLWLSSKNAFSVSSNYTKAKLLFHSEDMTYAGTQNNSSLNFTYSRIIKPSSAEGIRFLPGISLDNYGGMRVYPHLQNAAVSIDFVNSLSANMGFEYSYTKAEKKKRFLWMFPYTSKEKSFTFFANLKLPIMSHYRRPVYTNPGNITVFQNQAITNVFEAYKSKITGPIGLSTEIGISRVLANGNMIRLSYTWNAMAFGTKNINRFNDSKHLISVGLLFKIK